MTSSLQRQDYKFTHQTPHGLWRWTTRVDLSGASPGYWVLSIVAPWGLYRDDAPIPGDVVTEMFNSITTVQAAFQPLIVVGPPTSLTFDVDEGRGMSEPQQVTVSNGGVWGSSLGAAMVPSDAWLRATPPRLGGLASGAAGQVGVTIDSTDLLASLSPYKGSVSVTSLAAVNNPQTIPITVNVRPKPIIATDLLVLRFVVVRSVSGNFAPIPTQQFQLRNDGPIGALLQYRIQKLTGLSEWLAAFSPPVGSVPGQGAAPITVLVRPCPNMATGTYTEILRVSGYSENLSADVFVRLVVT